MFSEKEKKNTHENFHILKMKTNFDKERPEIKLMIRVRLKSDMINYRFLTSETNLNILLFFTQPNQ